MSARVGRLRQQGLLLVWLVLVWNLLWGTSPGPTCSAVCCWPSWSTTLLPLPPVTTSGRFRPLAALRFLGRFLVDLVVSSVEVSWLAFGPAGTARRSSPCSCAPTPTCCSP